MYIKKIDQYTFAAFANTHPLRSYHESEAYAKYMKNKGFKHHYIALVDNNNKIYAASLIIYKKLNFFYKYGYAPKGFLIDYHDTELLQIFLKELKKFYYSRNFAFIKINPEIAIGEIKNDKTIYNQNQKLIKVLENNGFLRIGPNYKFETLQPRFNAIIPLKTFSFNLLSKQYKTKIRKANRIGLTFEKVTSNELPIIYEFVKNKKNRTLKDYQNYYNAFTNTNMDFFLIGINFETFLVSIREEYEKELQKNEKLVTHMIKNPQTKNLERKLASDHILEILKQEIVFATHELAKKQKGYIAGAITIKYQNRISIITSGFDPHYKRENPNHFLHYELLKYYQDNYDFIDLNGITGDFTKENPYYGLNKFKLGFHPKCFEYIGEFDFIINPGLYKGMQHTGLIKEEFYKKQKEK